MAYWFFLISGSTFDNQLWKTDGTVEGTVRVKDFYNPVQDKSLANLANLTVIKNKLYFSAIANAPLYTYILCVSDGSTSGTHIISKSVVEPAQMVAGSSSNTDSTVYFSASETSNGDRRLYVTNGDSGNVAIAPGFNGFIAANYYSSVDLISKNGVIYFIGRPDAPQQAQSLFKYDITGANGIQPVKIVSGGNSSTGFSAVSSLANIDGTLYFTVYDAANNKNQFWRSDGNSTGNVLIMDSLGAFNFVKANGLIYFSGSKNSNGSVLWKTDGTANGTSIVKNRDAGVYFSTPYYLTSVNDKLLFAARDDLHGNEFWQTGGTNEDAGLIKDINHTTTSSSSPLGLTPFKNALIFTAISNKAINRYKVWKSDGTNTGTVLISDTIYPANIFAPETFCILGNQSYFFASSISGKQGLYKTDGTAEGTLLVKDFLGAAPTYYRIKATDSLIYFYLYNKSTSRYEIWRTDGTGANTFVITSSTTNFDTNTYVSAGKILFFVSANGGGLWKTDGSLAGTVMVKPFAYDPYNLKVFKGTLFFGVYDSINSGLWKSDGSTGGTVKITGDAENPSNFISSNGELFFMASSFSSLYGNVGTELFKTDGTANGTVLVKDIHPGVASTRISPSISANNLLYFFTDRASTNSIELWKSDGTTDGTEFISIAGHEGDGVNPTNLVTCNGKLFFMIGNYLWEADGTGTGTHTVVDNIFSSVKLNPYTNNSLIAVGNQLYFTANNYQYGQELYVGNISNEGVVNYISTADGNWNSPSTWESNSVPPEGAGVIIRNNVTGNVNAICNGLSVEASGKLTLNEGVSIRILQ